MGIQSTGSFVLVRFSIWVDISLCTCQDIVRKVT